MTRVCFVSVGFVLSLLSAPVIAAQPWDVHGGEARLGASVWVISASDFDQSSGLLVASDFVVIGSGGVLIRGERLQCTNVVCEMVQPVVYRKGSAVRAGHGELELATGRVVLKGLGNWTLEER